jgi:hypothetical protein
VVQLARNEHPPEHGRWVLVERDDTAKFPQGAPVEHDKGATFYIPDKGLESEVEAGVARATRWAADHNISTVYVREAFRAEP